MSYKGSYNRSFRKPRALKRGDTVALIRPTAAIDSKIFARTSADLRSLGFCVVTYPLKSSSKNKYLAASDRERAGELHWAFTQPGIKAVFCCRGGYGSVRTVAQFSRAQISKWRAKIFVGYSDITYLHQILQNEANLIGFHGPLSGFLNRNELGVMMKDLLALPETASVQKWAEIKNIGGKKKARGRLVGGNLSLLQTTGRAALPKVPMILALEDVNESHYRLDRMIWSLIDAGYGKYVKGIILGKFLNCGERDSKVFPFTTVLESLKKLSSGPIWMNAKFGHGLKKQRLLPLGCEVELDSNQFKILESVVQ